MGCTLCRNEESPDSTDILKMRNMKQAGRQTNRVDASFTAIDFFAEDVRRVLKQCKAPEAWGDEEAHFLLRLGIEPGFLTHDDMFPLFPSEQHERVNLFVRLSKESNHKLFGILDRIAKTVSSRVSRKGLPSHVWLLVQNYTLWLSDNVGRNKNPKRSHLLKSFWDSKAQAVADEWGKTLYEQFTSKDVEKARAAIHKIKPFKNSPQSSTASILEMTGVVRPFRSILGSKTALENGEKFYPAISLQEMMARPDSRFSKKARVKLNK
jgi:hypothetical protein